MDVEFEEVEEWVGDEGDGAVYVWGLVSGLGSFGGRGLVSKRWEGRALLDAPAQLKLSACLLALWEGDVL